MAKAPANTATVALTGVALLSAIAAAEGGVMLLTQAEGKEAADAGFIELTGVTEGDKAQVRLTDAGRAQLPKPAAPVIEIETGIAIPTDKARRTANRESKWPFDKLEVGQSFFIAATAEVPQPELMIASAVSGARARHAVEDLDGEGKQQFVEHKVIEYAKGADGKLLKGADGKRVKTGEKTERRVKMKFTRNYTMKVTAESDPKGKGVRIWRTA